MRTSTVILAVAAIAASSFLQTAEAQASVRCGKIDGVEKVETCPESAPCCCGTTPLHCGDHCQSAYSFNSKKGDPKAACYGDRFDYKCRSGLYNFNASTWVINSDAYNGDQETADFIAENRGLYAGNIRFGRYGGVQLALSPTPNSPSDKWELVNGSYPSALGSRLSSTTYMLYGTIKARFRTAWPGGIVTAFITYSDVKDEIDWEITGKEIGAGQSNFFYRGVVDYTKSKIHPTGTNTSESSHEYEVRWTKDSITWVIDGEVQRTVLRKDTCDETGECKFPSTPSNVEIAIWDGGGGGAGTRDWAGGYVPWQMTDEKGFGAIYEYMMIQCEGDPVPTGPPARKSGYSAPTLKEPAIQVAAPTVPGYDASLMSRKGSVYTQKTSNGSSSSSSSSSASPSSGSQQQQGSKNAAGRMAAAAWAGVLVALGAGAAAVV
ncbi:hypothetical protein HDU96_005950 [Phlyctochytrium bullatum]|nr:hypothetical protein HDU96_005950 [Phlyctochytrium bullatum]